MKKHPSNPETWTFCDLKKSDNEHASLVVAPVGVDPASAAASATVFGPIAVFAQTGAGIATFATLGVLAVAVTGLGIAAGVNAFEVAPPPPSPPLPPPLPPTPPPPTPPPPPSPPAQPPPPSPPPPPPSPPWSDVSAPNSNGRWAETRFITIDRAKHPNATCADGTSGGYDFREGHKSPDNVHFWIVMLEVGGWAYDDTSYTARKASYPYRVGSGKWNERYGSSNKFSGVMRSKENANLRNANLAFLRYCTSDAFMASADVQHSSSSETIRYRGLDMLRALLEELVVTHGMGHGPDRHTLVFGGHSAGARGAMVHLDYLPDMLEAIEQKHGGFSNPIPIRQNVDIYGYLDGALWIDMDGYNGEAGGSAVTGSPLLEQTKTFYNNVMVHTPIADRHLGSDCMAAHDLEPWKCIFGEYRMPHLQTKTVVVAALDDWFIRTLMLWNTPEDKFGSERNRGSFTVDNFYSNYVKQYGDHTRSLMNTLNATRKISTVGWRCNLHAPTLEVDQIAGSENGYHYFSKKDAGDALPSRGTADEALEALVFEDKTKYFVDGCGEWECSTAC